MDYLSKLKAVNILGNTGAAFLFLGFVVVVIGLIGAIWVNFAEENYFFLKFTGTGLLLFGLGYFFLDIAHKGLKQLKKEKEKDES